MIHKPITFILAAFLLRGIGCRHADSLSSTLASLGQDIILVDDLNTLAQDNTAAEILDASLSGDQLQLKVRFSGGRTEHGFTLFGAKGFLKSKPAQAELVLSHDSQDDSGEALITQKICFGLAPLRKHYRETMGNGDTILLRIYEPGRRDAFKALLVYTL